MKNRFTLINSVFVLLISLISGGVYAQADLSIGGAGLNTLYTSIPLFDYTAKNMLVTVSNIGNANATSVQVKAEVYDLAAPATPISSLSQNVASVAAGATENVDFGAFTPPAVGDYEFVFYTIFSGDANVTNDTLVQTVNFTSAEYARDNLTLATYLGVGAGTPFKFGNSYTFNTAVSIDSVLVFMNPGVGPPTTVGDSIRFIITTVNPTSGLPTGTIIGLTDVFTINTSGVQAITKPIHVIGGTGKLELSPGTYFVGYDKYKASNGNHGIAVATGVYELNACTFSTTGAFRDISSGLAGNPKYTAIIRPYVAELPPFTDVTVKSGFPQEYTILPDSELKSVPINPIIRNVGTKDAAGATSVSVEVFLAPDFTTPIQVFNGSLPTLAKGSESNLDLGTFNFTTKGAYLFRYISKETGDLKNGNDTLFQTITFAQTEYARDNGPGTTFLGTAAGNDLQFGNVYAISKYSVIDSIGVLINPAAAVVGNKLKLFVTGTNANGIPDGNIIGESEVFTTTVAGAQFIKLPIKKVGTTEQLKVTAGKYFVAYKKGEPTTDANMGVAFGDDIYTPNTSFAKLGANAYAEMGTLGFAQPPIVRAFIFDPCKNFKLDVSGIVSGCVPTASATVSSTGQNGVTTILWSNGQTTATVTSTEGSGLYTAVVTDEMGCVLDTTIKLLSSDIKINPKVFNDCGSGGSIDALVTGASGKVTYSWADGSTSNPRTSLTAGTYAVTVTDSIGCTKDSMGIVVANVTSGVPSLALGSKSDASCAGLTDGSINVTVSGGSGTINYTWIPNVSTTASASNIGAGSYKVISTDDNFCSDTIDVTLTESAPVVSTFDALASVCENTTAPTLLTTSKEGIQGTWSPSNLSTAAVGTVNATFTPNAGQCGTTASISLTVTPGTAPTFDAIASVCQGSTAPALPVSSTNGISGTWNPSVINTSSVGTSSYTFTPNNGQCASTAVVSVDITPGATPMFAPLSSICVGSPSPVLPTTSQNGITGTWSPSTFDTSTTGTKTSTFTPNSGQCSSTTTISLVVGLGTTPPVFSSLNPICKGDAVSPLPTTSADNITGTWSPSTFSSDTPGSYTATFTPSAGQCANTTSITLVVKPPKVPSFASINTADEICQGSTNAPNLSATSSNSVIGTWSPSTVVTTNVGTVTNTFTPNAGQCAVSTTLTFTIKARSVPQFSFQDAYCAGESIPVLPTFSSNGFEGSWSPTVDNTTTKTYTFTPNPSAGCVATITKVITITQKVNPIFNGLPSVVNVCKDAVAPVLPFTSANNQTGTWIPSSINTVKEGTTVHTFTPNIGQCSNTLSITATVTKCASLDEENEVEFTAFPNPTSGKITVQLNTTEKVQLYVTDLTGKQMNVTVTKVNSTMEIDLSAVANGTYLVTAIVSDGKSKTIPIQVLK